MTEITEERIKALEKMVKAQGALIKRLEKKEIKHERVEKRHIKTEKKLIRKVERYELDRLVPRAILRRNESQSWVKISKELNYSPKRIRNAVARFLKDKPKNLQFIFTRKTKASKKRRDKIIAAMDKELAKGFPPGYTLKDIDRERILRTSIDKS